MKPSLPQGTRDFGPDTVRKRNFIFNTIRSVFEVYGFQPLETPAMENIETLMGKYGDEGDKLIYRILDSGNPFTEDIFEGFWNYLKDFNDEVYQKDKNAYPGGGPLVNIDIRVNWSTIFSTLAEDLFNDPKLINKYLSKFKKDLAGKALKYDLTIPFARYVAMNHGQLTYPFKRYQVQPVWRADRPQRGRYREFYQCDADVVGSTALLNEVELLNIYATVFKKLGVDVTIRINSRKVLAGMAEAIEEKDRLTDITVAIDKIDKIGVEGVKAELQKKGLEDAKITLINELLFFNASNNDKFKFIKTTPLYSKSKLLQEGIKDIEYIVSNCENLPNIRMDLTIARGLNYYTGAIFEVNAKDVNMGSIGGGGRYDDLTGLFGVPNVPGVGISFGVDRIYDVMEELKLFPGDVQVGTRVLFFNLGEAESKAAFSCMQELRQKNIPSELFHETAKFDKQFKYAEKKNIPYIVIIGSKELAEKTFVVKDIRKGEQQSFPIAELGSFSFL